MKVTEHDTCLTTTVGSFGAVNEHPENDKDHDGWPGPPYNALYPAASGSVATLQGDCDDHNDRIFPGALDWEGDDIDHNCSEANTDSDDTGTAEAEMDDTGTEDAGMSGD
jgi:hypothetical protein